MTELVTFAEFDPTLHPIGHALSVELLHIDPSLDRGETSTTFSPAPGTAESFDWFEAYAA
jgi:hypothetical protein